MANRFFKFVNKYAPKWRKCPAGHWHRVSADDCDCGHTGKVLEWCDPLQRWIPNPTKTEYALKVIEEDTEFEIEKEARERILWELKRGNIQPVVDYKRKIMSGQ